MKERLPLAIFLVVLLLFSSFACSPRAPGKTSPSAQSTAAQYLSLGDRYTDQGESVRAEQYYLAARELGADNEVVLSRLLQSCIAGGRLGSAVAYAEEGLRKRPNDESLLRLAASLREALGHQEVSLTYVRELGRLPKPAPETLLFIAEFYERRAAPEALGAYEAYLAQVQAEEVPPWVGGSMRRIKELHVGKASVAQGETP